MIPGTTIPNSGVIVPERIYRGSQPTPEQIGELKAIGVNTIIDLREPWDRGTERDACKSLGIAYYGVPVGVTVLNLGLEPPTSKQLAEIFGILDAPGNACFVHCHNGADRTGDVIFAYRMHTGWTREAAMAEAAQYQDTAQAPLDRLWMEHYTPVL